MATTQDYLFKVVVVGNACVGKTALLRRYTDNAFEENYKTTIGCDFKLKNLVVNNKQVMLQMWDTSGEERFRSITSSFYRNADGLVIVFDLTNTESFLRVKEWLEEASYHSGRRPIRQMLLIGNKSDKTGERVVTFDQGDELAKSLGLSYIETSAKENKNVTGAFDTMCRKMLDSLNEVDFGYQHSKGRPDTVTLDSKPVDYSSWSGYCCSYV